MTPASRRPDQSEASQYYFRYIDQVPDGNILEMLASQREEALRLLEAIPPAMAGHRYAPDKWTLREVVGHLSDTERLFTARAFWFARGFDSPLPSFDQDVANAAGAFNERDWGGLIQELDAIRGATITLFAGLPADGWARRGIASGNPFSVRALAFLAVGHVTHHLEIVKTRYLAAAAR